MGRIPLSDEDLALDDDIVEEEGTPGKEERFDELDFSEDTSEREYEPASPFDEEDQYSDGKWSDEWDNNEADNADRGI